jgi:hypothetical protein
MIYSPDHKFLLLKNMKVGSTSLEIEIAKILPDNAIITDISGYESIHKPRNNEGFLPHSRLHDIQNKLNLKDVEIYIFVRNPYDSVMSDFFGRPEIRGLDEDYFNSSQDKKNKLTKNYIDNKFYSGSRMISTRYIYSYQDNPYKINFLKYENGIENEINPILLKHNLEKIKINTNARAFRPKSILYQDLFNDDQQKIIQEDWDWEFKNFRYSK